MLSYLTQLYQPEFELIGEIGLVGELPIPPCFIKGHILSIIQIVAKAFCRLHLSLSVIVSVLPFVSHYVAVIVSFSLFVLKRWVNWSTVFPIVLVYLLCWCLATSVLFHFLLHLKLLPRFNIKTLSGH